MLNPFPIQFLALFAYFLLRVCVGMILLYLASSHWRARHELKDILQLSWFPYGRFVSVIFPLGEAFLGVLLLLGAHTQYAALAIMAMSLKMLLLRNWFVHPSLPQRLFYALLFGAALSLFITGAGALAFDLPL